SHALLIHPPGRHEERQALISEMARLVYAGGQVLIGLPLSGSFPEIIDLLNEYALKFDLAEMELSLEGIAAGGVTEQVVAEELASQGLSDISWEVESATLTFDSGRALLEDPAYQLLIAPQLHDWLQVSEL